MTATSEVLSVRATHDVREPEVVLWDRPEPEVDYPSGAAAAMTLIAFVAFVMGLAVAGVILL